MPTPAPREESKLLDQVRTLVRLKHYSIRTEQAYRGWIKRFILFHHKRHPKEMGKAVIEAFLNHLAGGHHLRQTTGPAARGSDGAGSSGGAGPAGRSILADARLL